MDATPPVTVVIPTHNPRRALLGRVLRHLRAQTMPQTEWNLIIVDNASDPAIDEAWCREIVPASTVVRETRPGLLHARLAGIASVTGELVVFVDDDNLLAPAYLATVRRFMAEHPAVGIIGGRVLGEFELPPPAWAKNHLGSLALRDLGATALISSHHGTVTQYDFFAPYGAGMAVRSRCCRDFAARVAVGQISAVGRCGSHLGGCEDCELVMHVWSSGLECAYVPDLVVTHVIPAARLRFRYLQRLARQGQQSWAEFLCRHGLAAGMPRWTVPIRQLKAFVKHRAWTSAGFIRWRGVCGYFAGAAKGAAPIKAPAINA